MINHIFFNFPLQLKNDLAELNSLLSKATRTRAQNALNFEIRKVEADLLKLKVTPGPVKEESSATQNPPTKSSGPKIYEVKLQNYGTKANTICFIFSIIYIFEFSAWDQSDNLVKIFVTLNGVQDLPAESIIATCDDR
jgi:hypothetical protein